MVFLLLSKFLFAYSYEEILYTIRDVARKEGVANRILYTIVKIESNFEPFAMSFLTNEENAFYYKGLENQNITIKISNYSLDNSKWVVSMYPKSEIYAIEVLKQLLKSGFSVDVGLGQLNSQNFETHEIDYVFNPTYNLTKCSRVLRMCFNIKNKDMQKTIECYNYGVRNRNSNPYYKRFYEHYMREFN
ncbi:MAG: lytic transglycosylase domain-containing protein [Campylobacteraceae bacterium]|nr:lytic transglycosylase domain-containing protein [Campylobacteraceae bacterium]